MNFRPLYERIAVEVIQSDEKTKSGLLIPDTAKEKPMHGKVVALGKGYRNDKGEYSALEVKIGDTVIFGKWAGTEVKISDKEYLIMKESDVMVVVNN